MYALLQYLRHKWVATTRYGVHSPFMYEFVTQVLPHRPTQFGGEVEALRKQLLHDRAVVEIEDFGAGYGGHAAPLIRKTLRQVVKSSARSRREGEFLGRMARHYSIRQALELGTNLGFSALHILGGESPGIELVSIEGAKQLSNLASAHLERFGLSATLLIGEFSEVLHTRIAWDHFHPDFVLLDGNHRKQATLDYVELLLPRLQAQAILVLDDVHWSPEMTAAWEEVIRHPRITVSIDLFSMGVCFLGRPQAKEHFRIQEWPLQGGGFRYI